jgi:cell division protein FtsB
LRAAKTSRKWEQVAQVSSAATSEAGRSQRAPSGAQRARSGVRKHAPRPHAGRLALLALVLIGASFYVSPLRDFFRQQDRYEKAAAQLQAAQSDNSALEREVELLGTKAYIAQRARSDSNLIPPGTQLFVIKGLPGREDETAPSGRTEPVQASISVLDRVEDLWRTLLD